MKLNNKKYKLLVHYIAFHYNIGKVQLNKILFYSDFEYYRKEMKSITGETYIKQKFGPVPKSIDNIIQKLSNEGKITQIEERVYNHSKHRIFGSYDVSMKEFNKLFTAQEISIVDNYCYEICNTSGREITERSHTSIWKVAKISEELPYSTAFIYDAEPVEITKEDIKWAEEKLAEEKLAEKKLTKKYV